MVGSIDEAEASAESQRVLCNSAASTSIVVPILETASVLDLFLSGLYDTVPDGVQLILVDDGCGADTREILHRWCRTLCKRLDVSLISSTRPLGDGAAFNAGVARARGDFVVRLDSDLMFPHPWLDGLLAPLSGREDVGIAAGLLLYPQSGGVNHAGLTFYHFVGRHAFLNARPAAIPAEPYEVQTSALGFSAIRRDLLEAAGGFDPSYHSGYDDLDLALRIADLGGRAVIVPQSVAFHWERSAGPHRDAGRKRNLALFWHRWGDRIVDDLWNFLGPSVSRVLETADGPDDGVLGIDLCGDRVGAEHVWNELPQRTTAVLDNVRVLSHLVSGDGPIALPLVLGADGPRDPRRMLFLTDNLVRLRGNSYFFERRFRYRHDDIVIDMHGNALRAEELALVAWPGEKMR
jgi:GT2 family glycosyltransferase